MQRVWKWFFRVLIAAIIALFVFGIAFIIFSVATRTASNSYESSIKIGMNAAALSSGVSVKVGDEYHELNEKSCGQLWYYLTVRPALAITVNRSEPPVELLIGDDKVTLYKQNVEGDRVVVLYETAEKSFRMQVRATNLWREILRCVSEDGYEAVGESVSFDVIIGDGLPEMTLTLTPIREEDSGDVFRERVYRATLAEKARPESVKQQFTIRAEERTTPEQLITFADLNFDGYQDIDVLYYMAASNMVHRFFLWSPQAGQYVETELGDLEVSWYTLFSEHKIIARGYNETAVKDLMEVYQWVGEELVLLRRVDTSGPSDPDEIHLVVTDFLSGAPVITRDETIAMKDIEPIGLSDLLETQLWEGIPHGEPQKTPTI